MTAEQIENVIAASIARVQIVRRSPGVSQRELDLALSVEELAGAVAAMLHTPPPWLFAKKAT